MAVLSLAAACSASLNSNDTAGGTTVPGTGATGGSGAQGASGGTAGQPLPPETESEDTYSAPVVSGRWIWTANPLSGRVALIDAKSLDVTTTEAGLLPTYLAAIPGSGGDETGAVVINVGSGDATILHAKGGAIDGVGVPLHQSANRLTVSPDGHWALAWSDAALVENPDPTEGFQDMTVIDLTATPPAGRRLTVGYRPSRVTIAESGHEAYVVAEPGVSVIDLPDGDKPRVLRDIAVTADPTEAASTRNVTVTPDGTLALVRRLDSPDVEIVSLAGEGTTKVTLPGAVTDLDLSPDGKLAFAVVRTPAVARALGDSGNGGNGGGAFALVGEAGADAMAGAAGEYAAGAAGEGGTGGTGAGGSGGSSGDGGSIVAILPIPRIVDHPGDFTRIAVPRLVGSVVVAAEGDVALLYTNAVADDHLTILHYAGTPELRTVVVQAPVKAVLTSPDGAHAIALLGQAPGSQKPGGFSLVPVAENLPPKIVGTDAPPQAVAVGDEQALVTVSGPGSTPGSTIDAVYLGGFPGLDTTLIPLGSTPLSTALVPEAAVGFVAQSHPEGRITFIDLETGTPRTLTGFELSAGVKGRD